MRAISATKSWYFLPQSFVLVAARRVPPEVFYSGGIPSGTDAIAPERRLALRGSAPTGRGVSD